MWRVNLILRLSICLPSTSIFSVVPRIPHSWLKKTKTWEHPRLASESLFGLFFYDLPPLPPLNSLLLTGMRSRGNHDLPHSMSVVLNLVGRTEPHKFHTCIHRTVRSWKNKMCVVNFILLLLKISCRQTPDTDSPSPWGSIEPRLRTTVLRWCTIRIHLILRWYTCPPFSSVRGFQERRRLSPCR